MGKLTHWVAAFAVIAVLAGILGYGGAAGTAAPVAKVLFWFSVVMICFALTGRIVRRT